MPQFDNDLVSRLPAVRGRYTPNAALRQIAWMNAGGPAEVMFKPADREDLIAFITGCPEDVPVTVLGVLSNVIVRDGGIPGVVIRLGREFAGIDFKGEELRAGAAAMDMNVALASAMAGVAGFEFLSGVPGTIGGGLRMNAGAYGSDIATVLQTADVLFRDGTVKQMTPADMGLSYRHNDLPDSVIFMGAVMRGSKDDAAAIDARIMDIKTRRAETQPIKTKTGGSTFANPDTGDKRAWQLIDAAGCRGLKIGGAQVSELHCNFIINTGNASAADLERLGEEVRKRVFETSGVDLRWEIKRIGLPIESDADIQAFAARG
jgi:UDP-N-acetylmuramate dehydrogenase